MRQNKIRFFKWADQDWTDDFQNFCGSGLDQTDYFQRFCRSGLDSIFAYRNWTRTEFLPIRIGLGQSAHLCSLVHVLQQVHVSAVKATWETFARILVIWQCRGGQLIWLGDHIEKAEFNGGLYLNPVFPKLCATKVLFMLQILWKVSFRFHKVCVPQPNSECISVPWHKKVWKALP